MTAPRLEQFIRAQQAQEHGLVRMLGDDGKRDVRLMVQALREEGHPEPLVERLMQSFFNTADWMRNKGG